LAVASPVLLGASDANRRVATQNCAQGKATHTTNTKRNTTHSTTQQATHTHTHREPHGTTNMSTKVFVSGGSGYIGLQVTDPLNFSSFILLIAKNIKYMLNIIIYLFFLISFF
jgi:hypothetical protein